MALIILGIILNSLHIVHDQPQFSLEADPTHKLAAERNANYHFFHLQRARLLKRQKRVGQYAWLVLGIFIASSWWLYEDAVKATTASKQISSIRTLSAVGSHEAILSLILNDGSKTEYLVTAPNRRAANALKTDEHSAETLQGWQSARLGTAVDFGNVTMPLGVALRIAD